MRSDHLPRSGWRSPACPEVRTRAITGYLTSKSVWTSHDGVNPAAGRSPLELASVGHSVMHMSTWNGEVEKGA